jgi:hypothetical protein
VSFKIVFCNYFGFNWVKLHKIILNVLKLDQCWLIILVVVVVVDFVTFIILDVQPWVLCNDHFS